jgi:hypothetical protein
LREKYDWQLWILDLFPTSTRRIGRRAWIEIDV